VYEDVISVTTTASPESLYEIITNLERIKLWEPSHGLPMIEHEWFPSSGMLEKGSMLKVRSPLWTFVAECIKLARGREVKWGFVEGPLAGTESWIVEPQGNGCNIIKLVQYEVPRFADRFLWRLLGRRIHSWASLRQLESIKRLAEGGV